MARSKPVAAFDRFVTVDKETDHLRIDEPWIDLSAMEPQTANRLASWPRKRNDLLVFWWLVIGEAMQKQLLLRMSLFFYQVVTKSN
jgi:hypothetical protein